MSTGGGDQARVAAMSRVTFADIAWSGEQAQERQPPSLETLLLQRASRGPSKENCCLNSISRHRREQLEYGGVNGAGKPDLVGGSREGDSVGLGDLSVLLERGDGSLMAAVARDGLFGCPWDSLDSRSRRNGLYGRDDVTRGRSRCRSLSCSIRCMGDGSS